jgi:hypothetical protein
MQNSFRLFGDGPASLVGRPRETLTKISGVFFNPKPISYQYYLDLVGCKAQIAQREQHRRARVFAVERPKEKRAGHF